jgi:hypothetical protein
MAEPLPLETLIGVAILRERQGFYFSQDVREESYSLTQHRDHLGREFPMKD